MLLWEVDYLVLPEVDHGRFISLQTNYEVILCKEFSQYMVMS